MKLYWISIFLALLISIPFIRADDPVEGEELDIEVEDEDEQVPTEGAKERDETAATATGQETDEEEEEETKLQPSPDVETSFLMTEPAGTKDLPTNVIIKFLVGFYNTGEKDFIVDYLDASFRYPMDNTYYIQNYTRAVYNREVAAGSEYTFDYAFMVHDSYSGRPFTLVTELHYHDKSGQEFESVAYNETINVVEDDSGFNPETGFLYVFFICIAILLLFLGQQLLIKVGRKSGLTKKSAPPTEYGTRTNMDVDLDWIPKEVLNQHSKSPRATGKSPRQRKPNKA